MKLYNDDCLNVFKLIDDKSMSHTITSPPYNRKRNDKYKNYDDVLNNQDYKKLLITSINECLRITDGYVFYNIQKNYYNKKEIFELFNDYKDYILDVIIWGKNNPMPASGYAVTNSYEFILVMSKYKKQLKSNHTYTKNLIMTNVYSKNSYKKIHKAVMNPEIVDYLIKNFTQENDIIFDPFMGVGTTGVVAKEYNRDFIGIELDSEYYNICKERLED